MYFKCISIEYLLNCAHRNEYLQAYTKLHTHKQNIYTYVYIYRSYYIVHNCIAYTHESMYANLYIHKYIYISFLQPQGTFSQNNKCNSNRFLSYANCKQKKKRIRKNHFHARKAKNNNLNM